jgi:hypothetical protein
MDTTSAYRNELEELLIPVWQEGWPLTLAVGDGWLPLINTLVNELLEADPDIKIMQVKQKFGSLRVYATPNSQESRALIREAEFAAERTCENCGNPGRTGDKGTWSYVYCEDCQPEGWEPYNPEDD